MVVCKNSSRVKRILPVFVLDCVTLVWAPAGCLAAYEGCLVDARTEAAGDCWSLSDFPVLSMTPLPPPGTGLAAVLSYRRPFGLSDLEEKSAAVNVPLPWCVGSLGFIERGGGLYRERALSAAVSAAVPRSGKQKPPAATRPTSGRDTPPAVPSATSGRTPTTGTSGTRVGTAPGRMGAAAASMVSVSVSLTAFEVSVEGWRPARCASLSAGARASPVGSADVCVGLGNVVSSGTGLGLRQTFLVGVVLRPHPVVRFAAEMRRRPGEESSFHLGAELEPSGGVYLRCGLGSEPTELTVGFGVALEGIGLDTASSFHSVLGRTDSFSLSFLR